MHKRELKQRRRRRQRERQKSKQTRLAKQQLCKITKVIDELKGGISGRHLPEEWQCRTQIKMEIVLAELEDGEVGYSEHVK